MSGVFLLLLTIVLYGLGKAVIHMCYGKISDTNNEGSLTKLPLSMYLPQVILLILAFVLGIYIPFNM